LSDEFIREVDEEVRQERAEQLWRRYGRYVLGAAVAIVVATAAGVFWQNYQQQQRAADSHAFIEAVTLAGQNEPQSALDRLNALAADGTPGYALLARLREAGVLAQTGDTEAAVIVYRRIADDGDVASLYRDYARLMAVMLEVDSIDADAAESQLAALLAGDNAWRFSARELVALADLRAGRNDKARELLKANAEDPEAPQGIRARAAQLLATLPS
jgi:hypothetical protein